MPGVELEAVHHPVADELRHRGVEPVRRLEPGALLAVDRRERHLGGEEAVERGGQPVDVAGRPEAARSEVLLGRRVAGRDDAGHRAGLLGVVRAGQPEVDQDDAPRPGDDEVRRAHVAMEHPGPVDDGEGAADPGGDVERGPLGERRALGPQHLAEGLAVEQLEHQVGGAVLLEHLEHVDDPGVAEAGQHPGLAEEPLLGLDEGVPPFGRCDHDPTVAGGGVGEQLLQRHLAAEPGVLGLVGDAEPAPAEHPAHDEPAPVQLLTGRQLRRVGARPAGGRRRLGQAGTDVGRERHGEPEPTGPAPARTGARPGGPGPRRSRRAPTGASPARWPTRSSATTDR